jgi:hypothetical protein
MFAVQITYDHFDGTTGVQYARGIPTLDHAIALAQSYRGTFAVLDVQVVAL